MTGAGFRTMARRATVLGLLAGLMPAGARAAAWSQTIQTDPDSGVEVEVRSMLDELPSRGFYPVQVMVRNRGGRDGEWVGHFRSMPSYNDSDLMQQTRTLAVPRREERTVEFMVPLYANAQSGYQHPRLRMQFSGPGVRAGAQAYQSANYRGGVGPFLAVESGLAVRNKGLIEAQIATQNVAMMVATLTLPDLSTDLRAYSGIDAILMPRGAWDGLDAAYRHVLRQWLVQGGQLLLASSDPARDGVPADLAEGSGMWPERWLFGWGAVGGVRLDEGEVDPVALIPRLLSHVHISGQLADGYRAMTWPLRKQIPDIAHPIGLLLVAVVVIAVVIGPLNLFFAARSKRPTRVIWTTPLLSLSASLLLVVTIVVMDGFGGRGHRIAGLFLHAGERTAALVQEQVSRSGVLLRRDFALPPGAVVHRANAVDRTGLDGQLTVSGDGYYGGDWFSSRAITAQVIQHTEPSRSGIEVWRDGEGGLPAVFSSVDLTLSQLYLIDAEGAVWKTGTLRAGESRPLTPATLDEARAWWNERRAPAGGLLRALLDPRSAGPGRFFAEAEADRRLPLATLGSIRWIDDRLLVTGTLTESEEP